VRFAVDASPNLANYPAILQDTPTSQKRLVHRGRARPSDKSNRSTCPTATADKRLTFEGIKFAPSRLHNFNDGAKNTSATDEYGPLTALAVVDASNAFNSTAFFQFRSRVPPFKGLPTRTNVYQGVRRDAASQRRTSWAWPGSTRTLEFWSLRACAPILVGTTYSPD
jgi:hypothetical protein